MFTKSGNGNLAALRQSNLSGGISADISEIDDKTSMASEKMVIEALPKVFQLAVAVRNFPAALVEIDFPSLHFTVYDFRQRNHLAGISFADNDVPVLLPP